jgi:hypothetical protein
VTQPVYIVVGPPRSGTSALAGVLRRQGIQMYMGADAPDIDSPTGNQEDALIRIINNHLMDRDATGRLRDWDNPRYVETIADSGRRMIEGYIRCRARNAQGAWGVKDPRLCFLLEPWHEALRGADVRWIHIRRENRDAMVRSLIKMAPARLRFCGDPIALYRLASNWAESYHLACDIGLARIGVDVYRLTFEELLTPEGQQRLARHFGFREAVTGVRPELDRCGGGGKAARRC